MQGIKTAGYSGNDMVDNLDTLWVVLLFGFFMLISLPVFWLAGFVVPGARKLYH
jgi:hypothetical protein